MLSSIVVISWWSNCLGLYAIHKLIEHLPNSKIYVIQTGKNEDLKERFREFLPHEVKELFYPENEPAPHWKVLEFTVKNLLMREEGLWFFDHDTFLLENAETWMYKIERKLKKSKCLMCIADRKHYRSLTIPAFWISPRYLPEDMQSFSPFPEYTDPIANKPFIQITTIPNLIMPQKDTLEIFIDGLMTKHQVLTYDLESDFPKHSHLGGLNIFVYRNLPAELKEHGMQTAKKFLQFYKECPDEWLEIEDNTIMEAIELNLIRD
jgi:hypothetical protein